MNVKYLLKNHLIYLALEGQKKKRGSPSIKLAMTEVEKLDERLRFPVLTHMIHNDVEVRCTIALSTKKVVCVDMPIDYFNTLPGTDI